MRKAPLAMTFLLCSLAVVTTSAVWAGQDAPAVGSTPAPAVSQPVQTAAPSLDSLQALIFQNQPVNQTSCNWDCTAMYDQCETWTCSGCAPRLFSCEPATCYYRCICWSGECP
jgi:hypothetical protein